MTESRLRGPTVRWRREVHRPVLVALLFSVLTVAGAVAVLTSAPRPLASAVSSEAASPTVVTPPAVSSGQGPTGLSLGISVTPGIICVSNNIACPGDERTARVTMSVAAPPTVTITYPAVQVIFLLETTAYDGTYDAGGGVPGREYCADSSLHQPCEESNGVPFFVANAGHIAASIASANPRSSVTFGLVDFFSTGDAYDKDGSLGAEGLESVAYHVDIGTPVSANNFESAVVGTFQAEVLNGGWIYPGLNFGNNILHSDSITALYGVLMGQGIDWLPDAHHVLVLIGSTAPRDPSYIQNYCVSPSAAWRYACYGSQGPYSSGCEPSYNFGAISSPACLGWINSQDGNPNGSIAALTRTAPDCVDSLGGRCTIDTISLWTTPTDPLSMGWPGALDAGPGGQLVVPNVIKVLTAACDMALATGGSWDGPSYFACSGGAIGDLQFVAHGPSDNPNTANPSLAAAFRGVSFGPLLSDVIAVGGNDSMFRYVPFANVQPAPNLQSQTTCATPNGVLNDCPGASYQNGTGYVSLNWNWSDTPSENILHGGDTWTASFNVIAVGPPYRTVPVDACNVILCAAGGSDPVAGQLTSARYLTPTSLEPVVQSFPLAVIRIVYGPEAPIPSTTTPAAPASFPPPPAPALPLAPTPPATPVAPTSIAALSVQALGAGFLGAGFTRVAMKNRPLAVGQVNLAGPGRGRRGPPPRPVGRFI
jgi:hypothetical protein